MTAWPERVLLALAGLVGALGVGLAAAAAHGPGGANLETASRFLLFHAPTLVAVAAVTELRLASRVIARSAAALLLVGLVLFCGDLSVRAILAVAPLPMAAPTGGVLLILGWAALGLAALVPAKRN